MIVHPALQALTHGFIDYAGLFPPAKLPLAQAVLAYDSARAHAYGGFLARFVLPAARAGEALSGPGAPLAHAFAAPQGPWHFSILLRGAETAEAFFGGMADELAATATLVEAGGGRVLIDAFEFPVPADALAAPRLTEGFARATVEALGRAFPGAQAYFEIPWHAGLGEALVTLAHVPGARAKFRTGGLAPSNVPAVESVCDALVVAASLGLPFKFTAGLHEPVRHFDATVGAPLHGFLNLFLAAGFLAIKGWSREAAMALLASERAADFTLSEVGIAFRGEMLTINELRRTRAEVATSFGSCSFLEPVDGLARMGWLRA
jgi:hypothetical protein